MGIWRDAFNQLQQNLADGSWLRTSSYTIEGKGYVYRSFSEYLDLLKYVEQRADQEDGTRRYAPRTYARQGGRGR